MERVQSFEHEGKAMVLIDFSGLKPPEILPLVAEAKRVIRSRPEKSVHTITKVDGAQYNSDVIDAMKEFAKGNEPYVSKAAIVGLSGMQKIVFSAVAHLTARSFLLCATVEEAKAQIAAP